MNRAMRLNPPRVDIEIGDPVVLQDASALVAAALSKLAARLEATPLKERMGALPRLVAEMAKEMGA